MDYYYRLHLLIVVISAIMNSWVLAYTDPLDVMALKDFYKTFHSPPVLEGWKGGDPCEESWTGVACSGSSVIHLKIQGLNLTGHLGGLLYNLQNLKQLDVSSNKLSWEIPYGLPPNATQVNLALNYLNQSIPRSLTEMKILQHLNLSHNSLSGPTGNVFIGLDNLGEMDLSYNNFTGELPSSFGSLTSLSKLFLQNNRFTGSVTHLAELPLTDLNIQDNLFSGIIPQQFQFVPNLWMRGNKFHAGENSPPWPSPFDNIPVEQNISQPPTTQANEIENYPPSRASELKRKHMGPGGIATLLATGAALFIANGLRTKKLNRLASNLSALQSHSTSGTIGISCISTNIAALAFFAMISVALHAPYTCGLTWWDTEQTPSILNFAFTTAFFSFSTVPLWGGRRARSVVLPIVASFFDVMGKVHLHWVQQRRALEQRYAALEKEKAELENRLHELEEHEAKFK